MVSIFICPGGEPAIPSQQETISISLEGDNNELHFNEKTVSLDRDIVVPANTGVSISLTVDLMEFSTTDFISFEPIEHD